MMTEDTSIEELPNINQPDQFDLSQGDSSNGHFQWKSMAGTLKFNNFNVTENLITKLDI